MQVVIPFITGNRALEADYASSTDFAFGSINPTIGFGRARHSRPTKCDPESDIQFSVCALPIDWLIFAKGHLKFATGLVTEV